MEKSGGTSASDDRGACELMETVRAPTYVAYIWSGLTLVDTDCGALAESCGNRKRLLALERHLLEIFVQGPCWFMIFRSGSTSAEDVDAFDRSPGIGHALCLHKDPLRRLR